MINGKRIAVVMPAYNAEKTSAGHVWRTARPGRHPEYWSTITVPTRRGGAGPAFWLVRLPARPKLRLRTQSANVLSRSFAAGADVVIMLHPDYQYTPLLVNAMASMIAYDVYDVVLGSRIIGYRALLGGMPVYKYIANRLLTAFENLFLGVKLSEYHTGYRALARKVLTDLPLLENSDDFVFDNQMLAQCVHFGFRIGGAPPPPPPYKVFSRRLRPSTFAAA